MQENFQKRPLDGRNLPARLHTRALAAAGTHGCNSGYRMPIDAVGRPPYGPPPLSALPPSGNARPGRARKGSARGPALLADCPAWSFPTGKYLASQALVFRAVARKSVFCLEHDGEKTCRNLSRGGYGVSEKARAQKHGWSRMSSR
jgi:hypothetical protein